MNVNGQNLSVLDDFLQLEDKDVETLCRVTRWPGGVNAAGNQNKGMQVLAMAEANLKRMCYELRHYTLWADIMLLSVHSITLPVMDPKNWTKNFEAIDGHFRVL